MQELLKGYLLQIVQQAINSSIGLMGSRKAWAAALGLVIAFGWVHVEEPFRTQALNMIMVYIFGQGIADVGKAFSSPKTLK
jgi:hypothetical protein